MSKATLFTLDKTVYQHNLTYYAPSAISGYYPPKVIQTKDFRILGGEYPQDHASLSDHFLPTVSKPGERHIILQVPCTHPFH